MLIIDVVVIWICKIAIIQKYLSFFRAYRADIKLLMISMFEISWRDDLYKRLYALSFRFDLEYESLEIQTSTPDPRSFDLDSVPTLNQGTIRSYDLFSSNISFLVESDSHFQ